MPQCPICLRDLDLVIEDRNRRGQVEMALVCAKHGTINERWKNELQGSRLMDRLQGITRRRN